MWVTKMYREHMCSNHFKPISGLSKTIFQDMEIAMEMHLLGEFQMISKWYQVMFKG